MHDLTIARRYAQALFEEADADAPRVDADMEMLRDTFRGSRDLLLLFESPVVPREKKQAVVRTLFAGRLQPVTQRFVDLLIDNGREHLFPAVVEAYLALRDRQRGIVEAHVRVPQPLDAAQQAQLAAALERRTGRTVRLDVAVDPALIGGIVVRVGDLVYDASVLQQLSALREQFGAYAA